MLARTAQGGTHDRSMPSLLLSWRPLRFRIAK
jgi:hypothetical protein